ncbi:hypothetical protein [Endozoicomonas sp.]|uniref:hypothetical protein n=1 Tax=Endozoicomonas sp. TaxID=1892382 RepID=UPI002887E1B6|nr:hypothetical protein [Endozoicomonas sp.]
MNILANYKVCFIMDGHLTRSTNSRTGSNLFDERTSPLVQVSGQTGEFRTGQGGSYTCKVTEGETLLSRSSQSEERLNCVESLCKTAMQCIKNNSLKLKDLTVKYDGQAASIEGLETRLDQLEQKEKSEQRRETGESKSSGQNNELPRLSVLVSEHDEKLSAHALRFQILESTSYDGQMIWKINDYSRRKREAVNEKTLSLYSQPFYTSKYGYKMCARVYLNGDGEGKGTHCSLFFVMMKGNYDALLPWPFKNKVTMYLLDLGPNKQHYKDSFRPDPHSSSFQKPKSDMNIASGCPLFVDQCNFEESQINGNGKTVSYLKDDTVFFRFLVDTSNVFM